MCKNHLRGQEGEWAMETHQDFQVVLRAHFILYFLERRVNIVDTLAFSLGEVVGMEEADHSTYQD